MISRIAMALGAVSVAVPAYRLQQAPAFSLRSVVAWLVLRREAVLIAAVLLVAGLAHGVNMFHFPYYEDDEGTYMSQAWAVLHLGRLAPYTYFYDHAPIGWLQIALWTVLTGGFHTFGPSAVADGRVFMLLLQLASTFLVYGIGRRISGSALVAALAALLFALSAYGLYFHRRVLLDNITTPWMLLSVYALLGPRLSLQKVWLSALALAASVLSKEVTLFLIPAMLWLVALRAHRSQRLFALVGWLLIVVSLLSLYALMALLKGELFPPGTPLGGSSDHVSLLGTLAYQAGRGKDGGLLDAHSAFWLLAPRWARDEPLLVLGGTACAALALPLARKRPLAAAVGALTLSLWAFLARGGEVIEFYLVPLLPLLALDVALALGAAAEAARHLAPRAGGPLLGTGRALRLGAALLILAGIGLGYTSPRRGFAGDHAVLWTGTQADAQQQAYAWVQAHLPRTARLVMDNYAWTDLHDGAGGRAVFPEAHYYWKLDQDKAIKTNVFKGRWQNVDYLLSTIQVRSDARQSQLPLTEDLLKHSAVLAHFDTGGWPVEVREVIKPGAQAFAPMAYKAAQAFTFSGVVNTPIAHSTLVLTNPNVLPASVTLTFLLQGRSVGVQRVQVDASSQSVVRVSDLLRVAGRLGMEVRSDLPIGAALQVRSAKGAIEQVEDRFCSTIAPAVGAGRPVFVRASCRNGEDVHSFLRANGLSSALPWAMLSGNNAGISSDAASAAADYDGVGFSYSAETLAAAGIRPGEQIVYDGAAFGWPDVLPGTQDNMAAQGQTIVLPTPAPGAALAFLGSATHGPSSGTATITYADGTRQRARLGFSDWTLNGGRAGQPIYGNRAVVTLPYRNHVSGNREGVRTYLFEAEIPLVAGKAVVSVTLPSSVDRGALHVFAVALRS